MDDIANLLINRREEDWMSRRSKVAMGIGLTAFTFAAGAFPFLYSIRMKQQDRNLLQQDDKLSGSQVGRGAYVNTGSRDAGKDPGKEMIQ